jgi:threonine 3-dehydrogenase
VRMIGLFGRELWKTWEIADGLVASGALDPGPVVTHTFRMADHEEAFQTALSGEGCKVVIVP